MTNGADELITLISESYLEANDEIIVPSPSFSEYDFGARLMGAKVIQVPLGENYEFNIDAILSRISEQTKLIYICSPNNPTGTYLSKAKLNSLLESIPKHVLVVFDGAYSHFATAEDYSNGIEFVQQDYPIIVLQTFSKIYGLAGVRIGFGVASQEIVKDILKVKEPFNVNSLAQVAAVAALSDQKHLKASQEINENGRKQLYETFDELGLHFIESMSNFVLVQFGPYAEHVYKQLMANGIIVRSGATWGLNEYLRISIGTFEENKKLLETIQSILNEQ
ncbi:pyridoxal phosphate-dependent aminotransferase [Metabacillus bambusae]|uniref:pyridoxal phosphate-dependent aminotransferase n=1 Tax=Metabacillus bambusae TaxID=2795218 RepID=UPI0027DE6424|nr:histidinol-phosphate transaminase [Metabacillus bambusae]